MSCNIELEVGAGSAARQHHSFSAMSDKGSKVLIRMGNGPGGDEVTQTTGRSALPLRRAA